MPHDREIIQEILAGLPLAHKLAHLALSVIIEDKPEMSIENLIELAKIMARHLPLAQQTSVIWFLNEAAAELKGRWN